MFVSWNFKGIFGSTWPSSFQKSHDNKDAVIDKWRLLLGVFIWVSRPDSETCLPNRAQTYCIEKRSFWHSSFCLQYLLYRKTLENPVRHDLDWKIVFFIAKSCKSRLVRPGCKSDSLTTDPASAAAAASGKWKAGDFHFHFSFHFAASRWKATWNMSLTLTSENCMSLKVEDCLFTWRVKL